MREFSCAGGEASGQESCGDSEMRALQWDAREGAQVGVPSLSRVPIPVPLTQTRRALLRWDQTHSANSPDVCLPRHSFDFLAFSF